MTWCWNVLQLDIKLWESQSHSYTPEGCNWWIWNHPSDIWCSPRISSGPIALIYIDNVTTIPFSVGTNWCCIQTMCCSTGWMNTQRTTQCCKRTSTQLITEGNNSLIFNVSRAKACFSLPEDKVVVSFWIADTVSKSPTHWSPSSVDF